MRGEKERGSDHPRSSQSWECRVRRWFEETRACQRVQGRCRSHCVSDAPNHTTVHRLKFPGTEAREATFI